MAEGWQIKITVKMVAKENMAIGRVGMTVGSMKGL